MVLIHKGVGGIYAAECSSTKDGFQQMKRWSDKNAGPCFDRSADKRAQQEGLGLSGRSAALTKGGEHGCAAFRAVSGFDLQGVHHGQIHRLGHCYCLR